MAKTWHIHGDHIVIDRVWNPIHWEYMYVIKSDTVKLPWMDTNSLFLLYQRIHCLCWTGAKIPFLMLHVHTKSVYKNMLHVLTSKFTRELSNQGVQRILFLRSTVLDFVKLNLVALMLLCVTQCTMYTVSTSFSSFNHFKYFETKLFTVFAFFISIGMLFHTRSYSTRIWQASV